MGKLTDTFQQVREAGKSLAFCGEEKINEVLRAVADATESQAGQILSENAKDLARMVGRVLSETLRPNGMKLTKVSVPFGVIGIVYEARPNVTLDVFSLCFKSGNACLLKGGSDADCSNRAIVSVIHSVLIQQGLNPNLVVLLPPDRESAAELLNARGYVDLLIPRGGKGLIDFVRRNATVPVIETGAGVCHAYFDRSGGCYYQECENPSCQCVQCVGLCAGAQGASGRSSGVVRRLVMLSCDYICRPRSFLGFAGKLSGGASPAFHRRELRYRIPGL